MLVNIFAHQIKANGADFSSKPGIVLVDKPIQPFEKVSRATVGQSYEAIVNDLKDALTHFTAAGGDGARSSISGRRPFTDCWRAPTSTWRSGTMPPSRLRMRSMRRRSRPSFMTRLLIRRFTTVESRIPKAWFALAINATQNWQAQSCGTIWSTYSYSPSLWLQSLYKDTDCRTNVWVLGKDNRGRPVFNGGKFAHFSSGNNNYGTCYIVNAPEMFLIIAEANVQSSTGSVPRCPERPADRGKRNSAITSASDLPSTKTDLMAFIKEERARELFQEGLRLYDLRRWDEKAQVYANNAATISFKFTDYKISDLVYPIPVDEVNAGFGVAQNEGWSSTLPSL